MSQFWKYPAAALVGVVLCMLIVSGQHEADIRQLKREVAELQRVTRNGSEKVKVDGYVDGTPGQGSYMPKVQGVNPVQTKDLMIPEDIQGALLVKIVGDERVWEMRPRVRKR